MLNDRLRIDGCISLEEHSSEAILLIEGVLYEVPVEQDGDLIRGESDAVSFTLNSAEPPSDQTLSRFVGNGELKLKNRYVVLDISAFALRNDASIGSIIVMETFDYLESPRLIGVMDEFPWEKSLGAELCFANGEVGELTGAQVRSSSVGPLLKAKIRSGTAVEERQYNRKPFESGQILGLRASLNQPELMGAVLPLFASAAYQNVSDAIDQREKERARKIEAIRQQAAMAEQRRAAAEALDRREHEEEERKNREWDERRRQAAQEEKRASLEKARLDSEFEKNRKYDLVILDLDGTLLDTHELSRFHDTVTMSDDSADYDIALSQQLGSAKYLIDPPHLAAISDGCKGMKLAVVTRTPRRYATKLLDSFYPGISWDSIIASEDVGHVNGDPDGYWLAFQRSRVKDRRRVLVIGDSPEDVEGAYRAGFDVALFTRNWPAGWRRQDGPEKTRRYKAWHMVPSAILETGSEIRDLLTVPERFLPLAEHYLLDPAASWETNARHRVDVNHFNNLDSHLSRRYMITVSVLGRYFSSRSSYSRLHRNHGLTRAILKAKDGDPYPDRVIQSVADHIKNLKTANRNLVVCPVPARNGRPRRVEDLVEAVQGQVGGSIQCAAGDGILAYRDGARSNKWLNREERFENVRDNLYVPDPSRVKGQSFVVIDDVVTSGATLFYAQSVLCEAGARSVEVLALAQSI